MLYCFCCAFRSLHFRRTLWCLSFCINRVVPDPHTTCTPGAGDRSPPRAGGGLFGRQGGGAREEAGNNSLLQMMNFVLKMMSFVSQLLSAGAALVKVRFLSTKRDELVQPKSNVFLLLTMTGFVPWIQPGPLEKMGDVRLQSRQVIRLWNGVEPFSFCIKRSQPFYRDRKAAISATRC